MASSAPVATWAIGDVQGCFRTLERLLERAGPASTDDLVLVGDLVNRGTGSLEALRWAVRLGERLRVVLGNHDLHLLGLAAGVRRPKGKDTLGPVLGAKDRDELLDWLAARPLLLRLDVGGRAHVIVHAGLLPGWDVPAAARLADEVQGALRADRAAALEVLFAREGQLRGSEERVRATAAALTRLRTIGPDGPDWEFNGAPAEAPRGRRPWFEVEGRRSADTPVVFGHWAALGLHLAPTILALDSGCVWGRSLTAVRLDDRSVVQEPTVRADLP